MRTTAITDLGQLEATYERTEQLMQEAAEAEQAAFDQHKQRRAAMGLWDQRQHALPKDHRAGLPRHHRRLPHSNGGHKMSLMNHNGIDVGSRQKVDRAHAIPSAVKEEYRIRQSMLSSISTARTRSTCWTWTGTGGRSWPSVRVGTATPMRTPAVTAPGSTTLFWANTDHVMDDEIAAKVRDTVPSG
jgi:hypothetical protein